MDCICDTGGVPTSIHEISNIGRCFNQKEQDSREKKTKKESGLLLTPIKSTKKQKRTAFMKEIPDRKLSTKRDQRWCRRIKRTISERYSSASRLQLLSHMTWVLVLNTKSITTRRYCTLLFRWKKNSNDDQHKNILYSNDTHILLILQNNVTFVSCMYKTLIEWDIQ